MREREISGRLLYARERERENRREKGQILALSIRVFFS